MSAWLSDAVARQLSKNSPEDHSTRLLLLRLNSFEMEDFLLFLAFFTPIHQNWKK